MNAACVLALGAGRLYADATLAASEIPIRRAAAPIDVDGDLGDAGWEGAVRVETWYETNPGDNVPPQVQNVGRLAYDERFFYAAFEFQDPDPGKIRAPLGDHDNVPGYTDYGGVILDTRNDGKTGILFLANPRGVQYDAVSDDVTGNEDSSPDFFWDAAGRVTKDGWTLEIRIPFSSLRYPRADPRTWGIMLYRNYPRDFRYQMFSTRLPRGGQCFICYENKLTGLTGLPSGGHMVLAPYVNASKTAAPEGDVLGADLKGRALEGELGLDLKWTPGASTAVDGTLNPDFSQIESDVAQIGANERFALFFPEKRPFFLEGVELFSTPIQAVYTRTITSPRWGVRATGKSGATAFTGLVAEDRGGGSAILPAANSSDLADQDFRSFVAIGRARRDIGRSFVSLLLTDREVRGGGHNRVLGPDFQWRPNEKDTVTGQLLFSDSQTPRRPDLTSEWDGRSLSGRGLYGWWLHTTRRVDLYSEYKDFSHGFRADDGFVPQVGYRRLDGEYGFTFRPQGFFRRLRPFLGFDASDEAGGATLQRQYSLGVGMDARWNTSARFRYAFDHVRAGDALLPRQQLLYNIQTNPSRAVSGIVLSGWVGEEVDFDNRRTGTGANVNLQLSVRPSSHLELRIDEARRWLDVRLRGGSKMRLFSARVDRLRATYTFTARAFLRAIAQWAETRRDPALYASQVDRRNGTLAGSALFAYKLNWQTVLFVGFGDTRALTESEELARADRQVFVKLSYAFQK